MRSWLPRLLVIVGLAGIVALAYPYRDQFSIDRLDAWLDAAGIAAPLLFIAIYAVAAVLFLPGSVLTLAGGALFGPLWGTVFNLTGATIGAALAFLIARYAAADWVRSRAGKGIGRLIQGVEAEGWRFVAFTRLVPLFPFNLLNYALGLTRIGFVPYVIASFVFMLPGAVAYTWLGYVGREAAAGREGLIEKVLIALALLACALFLPRLITRMRRGGTLPAESVANHVGNSGLILDVRSPEEFDGELGHIEGSLNIPLDELDRRLDGLGDDPERPIAIVCRTDRRSATAATVLSRHGFANAKVLRGGMTAWIAAGLPVEGCSPTTGGTTES